MTLTVKGFNRILNIEYRISNIERMYSIYFIKTIEFINFRHFSYILGIFSYARSGQKRII